MFDRKPERTDRSVSVLLVAVAAATVIGFLAGMLGSSPAIRSAFGKAFSPEFAALFDKRPAPEEPPAAPQAAASVFTEEEQVVSLVEKASPAVVSIVISRDVPIYEQYYVNPFGEDDLFRQFFENAPQFGIPQYRQQGTEKRQVGSGSGFIVSEDGYVVTNRHVVSAEDAEYTVIMSDGKKFTARVLGRDPANDIAVLKIDPEEGGKFPTVTLGDSDAIKVGQKAVAIGYALGRFSNTVSLGIVSGLQRSIQAGDAFGRAESLFDVIQTDTAINPGNSGGPLLNLRGEAIGMNVAIVQGAQSVGFALPINDVKRVVESVRTGGKISRPFLGVRYVMLNKELQKAQQLPVDYGALIVRGDTQTDLAVTPGSPADIAGLMENDIILEVNGKKLTDEYPLFVAVSKLNAGDKVTLKVLSKGKERTVEVTLAERQ